MRTALRAWIIFGLAVICVLLVAIGKTIKGLPEWPGWKETIKQAKLNVCEWKWTQRRKLTRWLP